MQVRIDISGSTFSARLRLPRALVLSAALALAGIVTNSVRIQIQIGQLQQKLADCKRRVDALTLAVAGQ